MASWKMRDSEGRSSTNYVLYVATRAGPKKLAADGELVAELVPGQSIIAFVRRGHLDAIWRVAA